MAILASNGQIILYLVVLHTLKQVFQIEELEMEIITFVEILIKMELIVTMKLSQLIMLGNIVILDRIQLIYFLKIIHGDPNKLNMMDR